jgi:hypothetical protein
MSGTMVDSTEWHREFIADIAAERGMLGEPEMVWIRWLAAAHEAGLLGDMAQMFLGPDPARLRQGERVLVDAA